VLDTVRRARPADRFPARRAVSPKMSRPRSRFVGYFGRSPRAARTRTGDREPMLARIGWNGWAGAVAGKRRVRASPAPPQPSSESAQRNRAGSRLWRRRDPPLLDQCARGRNRRPARRAAWPGPMRWPTFLLRRLVILRLARPAAAPCGWRRAWLIGPGPRARRAASPMRAISTVARSNPACACPLSCWPSLHLLGGMSPWLGARLAYWGRPKPRAITDEMSRAHRQIWFVVDKSQTKNGPPRPECSTLPAAPDGTFGFEWGVFRRERRGCWSVDAVAYYSALPYGSKVRPPGAPASTRGMLAEARK